MIAVSAVTAVRTAVLAEPVARALAPRTAVLAWKTGPAPAQQAQRSDDRIERIRGFSVLSHAPILHAT